jgi:hypothetical protein
MTKIDNPFKESIKKAEEVNKYYSASFLDECSEITKEQWEYILARSSRARLVVVK